MMASVLPRSLPIPAVSHKNFTRSSRKISSCHRYISIPPVLSNSTSWVEHFRFKSMELALSGALAFGICLGGSGSADAKVGVNKPELLPKEFSTVIDVAGFLSAGQENRLRQEIADLEEDTGFKLRVLAQNYPETPGLAIRDFWQVDDRTIIFVADPTFEMMLTYCLLLIAYLMAMRSGAGQTSGGSDSDRDDSPTGSPPPPSSSAGYRPWVGPLVKKSNILNFNVGATVDLDIPRSFWSRLAGKYGNIFYWKEKGEDASVEAAVKAIGTCLREPIGRNNCTEVK